MVHRGSSAKPHDGINSEPLEREAHHSKCMKWKKHLYCEQKAKREDHLDPTIPFKGLMSGIQRPCTRSTAFSGIACTIPIFYLQILSPFNTTVIDTNLYLRDACIRAKTAPELCKIVLQIKFFIPKFSILKQWLRCWVC